MLDFFLELRGRQLLNLVEELRIDLVTQILDLESALIPIKARMPQLLLSRGTVGFLSSPSWGDRTAVLRVRKYFLSPDSSRNILASLPTIRIHWKPRQPSGHRNAACCARQARSSKGA